MEKALRLSLEQSEKDTGNGGGATIGGGVASVGGMGGTMVNRTVVSKGTIDALAAEKHGRWFSFDDRKVQKECNAKLFIIVEADHEMLCSS